MADMAISRQQTGHRYLNINSSGRTHLGDVHNLNVTYVHHPMGESSRRALRCSNQVLITLTADLADVPPSPLSTVPFPRDPDYVRRSLLIEQIHTKLSVPGARVALVGLGGVGYCILEFRWSRAPADRDVASRSSPSIMLIKSETIRHRRGCYGSTPPVQHALSRALARPLTT
jgi:hypothetical protein